MHLTLSIIMDELAGFKPIVHKMSNIIEQIQGFHYYSTESTEISSEYLYVGTGKAGKVFGKNCPKHILITGDMIPKEIHEKADTLIQIPGNISVEVLLQTGHEIFASFESWYNSLLMAVIEHKTINVFLEIAVQKFINPLAVFNNNSSTISSAGSFLKPVKGTIWEHMSRPGFVLGIFFTLQDMRNISRH